MIQIEKRVLFEKVQFFYIVKEKGKCFRILYLPWVRLALAGSFPGMPIASLWNGSVYSAPVNSGSVEAAYRCSQLRDCMSFRKDCIYTLDLFKTKGFFKIGVNAFCLIRFP